jgi:chromosome segregation ATPase
MCFCKDGATTLQKQIDAAGVKIPRLESTLKEATAQHQRLTQDLGKHREDRNEAQQALDTATALREKSAESFGTSSADLKANIAALTSAISSLNGAGNSGGAGFLQTQSASVLRKLSLAMDEDSADRDVLTSFLSGTVDEAGSGEILGILKQLEDGMSQDLAEITDAEKTSIEDHKGLVAAKRREISATSSAIEQKLSRVGDLAVEISACRSDLDDTREGLKEDQHFITHMKEMCQTKKDKWVAYQKLMSEEMKALAETITLLNNDDSLDLFKKTLPSPKQTPVSFLQLHRRHHAKTKAHRAALMLRRIPHKDRRIDFLERALKGQAVGFEVIKKKIDKLIELLHQEQRDDDAKKDYCTKEIDKTEDDKKVAQRTVSDREKSLAQAEDSLAEVTEEIKQTVAAVKALDEEVASQTELRKDKHSDVVEKLASNNAANSLLEIAKKRLLQFYNPNLALISQVSAANPAQKPPEADLSYQKKGQESHGVIAMIDLLRADLTKETIQLEEQDKDAQEDYEMFLKDASEKRLLDSKAVADLESAKAEVEATLHEDGEALRSEKSDLVATVSELQGLHGECDWLLTNFDTRRSARDAEADSLEKAQAVLSGADYA